MSEFTAEDFAQAMFARHPDPYAVDARYAARMSRDPEFPWLLDGVPGNGDEDMAADGWVPVVEADSETLNEYREQRFHDIETITEQGAAISEHLTTIRGLRRRLLADVTRAREDAETTIRDLRQDLSMERERALDAESLVAELRNAKPEITLDSLEAAWEAAEQAGECRKGDVLIREDEYGGFHVYPAASDGSLIHSRILSRAPKREPWQDLADALRGTVWERLSGDVDGLAAAVHAAGWRKGGEES